VTDREENEMKTFLSSTVLIFCLSAVSAAAETPKASLTGLKNPESVCYGPKGLLYVTEIGEFDTAGDGKVTVIEDGKARTFATGLDDPKGIVFYKDALYVTDRTKIVKVDDQGQTSVYAAADRFPTPPQFLNDIAIDAVNGIFLVSDSGDRKGKDGAVYWIDVRLDKITTLVDSQTIPELHTPNGVIFDGSSSVLVADFGSGAVYRVRVPDRSATKIASGLDGADGLVWDDFGRLFITSWKTGKVFAIRRPGQQPVLIAAGLQSAADGCLDSTGRALWIPDMKGGSLTALSTTIPGWEVNEDPLPVALQPAFANLKWTGWDSGAESGKTNLLRPVLLTHAPDGSNRVFVLIQQGVIHAFDNDDNAAKTKIFLDISDRARWREKENEEGLLGLAFHPKFKQNGELFVFYTDRKAEMANVVSRFHVKANDPTTADPASEEEIIRFEKPFDNHDGGTIAFGPDGYLYIAHGDGGLAGDPYENGQNVKTLLGKILRIDVDRKSVDKSTGKNYGIPADNPFANQAGAAPEVWAYGLRNPWRMAFDSKTGQLWTGDVGQGLFEEIDLLKTGGNYGWNLREGLHPFGAKGIGPRQDLIDPIWEYHHNLGLSITGGLVYRGAEIPELNGAYLYGDYVSNRIWALRYDAKQARVVANQPIKGPSIGIMSFGEDEKGEAYIMGASATGQGIFRFVKAEK
jgi:glucose/arabinose dehydrogenase